MEHQKRARDEPDGTACVVGVTGHRPRGLAGADRALLEARVRDALEAIRDAVNGERFALLSPVAEGADQLVARAAVRAGTELRCVLPFARDDYLLDFATVTSRAEFVALLKLASAVVELPGSRATPEAVDAAYAAVGDWIVARSDLLVAIWDGGEARGSGGTGDVVQAALDNGLPTIWIGSQPPHTFQILTRHDGATTERAGGDLAAILRSRRRKA